MNVTEQDHKDYVKFLFGEVVWTFHRYMRGTSYWKASDGGQGRMKFTDGWVLNWKREQARKNKERV